VGGTGYGHADPYSDAHRRADDHRGADDYCGADDYRRADDDGRPDDDTRAVHLGGADHLDATREWYDQLRANSELSGDRPVRGGAGGGNGHGAHRRPVGDGVRRSGGAGVLRDGVVLHDDAASRVVSGSTRSPLAHVSVGQRLRDASVLTLLLLALVVYVVASSLTGFTVALWSR
jgi:hypothetical protein